MLNLTLSKLFALGNTKLNEVYLDISLVCSNFAVLHTASLCGTRELNNNYSIPLAGMSLGALETKS